MTNPNLHLTTGEVVKGGVATAAVSADPISQEHVPYLLANHLGPLSFSECIQVLGSVYIAYMLFKGLGGIYLARKLLVKLGVLDES